MAHRPDDASSPPGFFAPQVETAHDAGAPGPESPLQLAWRLRQCEWRRARELAGTSEEARGRAALVHAECALLAGKLEEAMRFLDRARAGSEDPCVRLDADLMEAMVASAQGRAPRALDLADAVARLAVAASIPDRAELALAYGAFMSVYAAPAQALERLERVERDTPGPVAAVYAGLARCMLEFNRGDHAAVARRLQPLVEQAERLGMVQLQLRMQNTLAAAYSNLDDKDTAISWVERSIEQARALDWPVALGEALAFLGNFYRESGQVRRAIETLQESRAALAAAPLSRGHALACCYLAHASLAAGDAHEAAERAAESEQAAHALNAVPIVIDALTVAGRAMARAGRPHEGLARVQRALELAEAHQMPVWRIDALRAMAEIHAQHDLPAPEGVSPAEAPLHLLRQALAAVDAMGGHAEKVGLLVELARAHERAGDLAAALATQRAALAQATSDEAHRIGNRLLAVEARHHVERQRLEIESQRRIAQAQQARAEALDRANAELRKVQAELEVLASTDPLTGVANRRSFLASAEAEVARSLRYGRPMALLVGDIDRFKSINDSYGHPCGDRVIGTAALTLDVARRTTDRLGRIGGEEFALVLAETDGATASAVAERLRHEIESASVEWEGRRIPFTMSFGAAVLDPLVEPGADPVAVLGALIQRADSALYEAKAAGRNRVAGLR